MEYSPWSSKNLIDRNQPKKFMQHGLMSHACTPILVGVVSLVSEILVLSKMAKFPFRPMDYSPWSSKNLIDRNQPKKFMQHGLMSHACTPILVGVVSLVSEIFVLSKTAKFPWSSKNLIDRNWPKKIMQVGIDVKCMHIKFDGCGLSGFGDIGTFKNCQISLLTHGL